MDNNGPLSTEKLPNVANHQVYTWVDYVELLCMVNLDGIVTKESIHDRVIGDVSERPGGRRAAEHFDAEILRVHGWFEHLNYRARAFKEFYPFELSADEDQLMLRNTLSLKHRLYLFLLLASNLRCFNTRSNRNVITSDFERLGKEVLQNHLAPTAQVHIFGSSSTYTAARYQGNTWTKIQKLAQDIRGTLLVQENAYASTRTGDLGVDLVAWVPTGDTVGSMLIFLGQCACTDEWKTKQYTSSYTNWRGKISCEAPTNNMVLIPICFRKATGHWDDSTEISDAILVDRLRFVLTINDGYRLLETLPSYPIVQEVLDSKAAPFG